MRRAYSVGMCLLGMVLWQASASAQTPAGPWWIGVDFVQAIPLQEERTTKNWLGDSASYPKPDSTPGFGVEGGFWLWERLGLAVRYEPARYSEEVEVVARRLNALNLPITASAQAPRALDRVDHAVDLGVVLRPWRSDRVDLRIIGGPTMFRIRQDMVSLITLHQVPPAAPSPDFIAITAVELAEASATGVGWNVGGEGVFFVTPHVGLSAGVRARGGHVTVVDPLLVGGQSIFFPETESELDATRVSITAGVRVRF